MEEMSNIKIQVCDDKIAIKCPLCDADRIPANLVADAVRHYDAVVAKDMEKWEDDEVCHKNPLSAHISNYCDYCVFITTSEIGNECDILMMYYLP